MLLVQRLGTDAGPAGDFRPRVSGLSELADLVALAELGHLAEGADAGEGEFWVVFEAERAVGVAGCYLPDLVVFVCPQPRLIARRGSSKEPHPL
jgi:hypothetical protein